MLKHTFPDLHYLLFLVNKMRTKKIEQKTENKKYKAEEKTIQTIHCLCQCSEVRLDIKKTEENRQTIMHYQSKIDNITLLLYN